MSFTSIPLPVKANILSCLVVLPRKFTQEEALFLGRVVIPLNTINKEIQQILVTTFKSNDLKEIYRLVGKYRTYNSSRSFNKSDAPPQLLDALFTGCTLPMAAQSVGVYSPYVESDIRSIVRVMPESIHCKLGQLRLRWDLPPLYAACVNEQMPLNIIELLLQNKANPYARVGYSQALDHMSTFVIHLLDQDLENPRKEQIMDLFERQGFPNVHRANILSLYEAYAEQQRMRSVYPCLVYITIVANRIVQEQGNNAFGKKAAQDFILPELDYYVEKMGLSVDVIETYLQFDLLDQAWEHLSKTKDVENLEALDAVIKAFEKAGRKDETKKMNQLYEELQKLKAQKEALEFQTKLAEASK